MEPISLPLHLSAASGVPFYRQVEDQIAEMIRAGRLPPGAQLPSVRDLSASLLVSLITVRRAYADLEAAGFLVLRQGQGTFVAGGGAPADPGRARDEAREGLRQAVVRTRAVGLSDDEIRGEVEETLVRRSEDGRA